MLQSIVQKFRGVVLLFVVGLLSAVFVLQFGGSQSQGFSGDTIGYAAEIYGTGITPNEFRSAYTLAGGDEVPPDFARQNNLEEVVLHGLVERNLLSREARRLGYQADEDEVMRKVAEEGVILLSMSVSAGSYLPPSGPRRFSFNDSDGNFSKKNLENFIRYRLRKSIGDFTRTQVEETLAQNMRDAITASVVVSPSEVWDAYVREKEAVTLKYARYSPSYYGRTLSPDTATLKTWIGRNQADVDAEYEKQKHRYLGLEKQVRSRHILLKFTEEDAEADKQAAFKKIAGLLARARKGEDFAELASSHSEDTVSARKGGDLGFNTKGRMPKSFDEAQFALTVGEISEPVESSLGYHVIKVEAIREGDVPVEEAKLELAEKLFRERRADELAMEAASEMLGRLKQGLSIEDAEAELSGLTPETDGDEDTLPPKPDPLAPQFTDTRPFGRTDTAIAGPFDSAPLVKAAFEMSEQQPLPDAPIKLGRDYFVYRLVSSQKAVREEFGDDERDRIQNGLLIRKRREVLSSYVLNLKQKAIDSGDVVVDAMLLSNAEPTSQPAR